MSRRSLSLALVASLLVQAILPDLALSSVWEDRRPAVAARKAAPAVGAVASGAVPSAVLRRHPELAAAVEALASRERRFAVPSVHQPALASIPARAASVREVVLHPSPAAPLVFIIQDIHDHEEAQKNIAAVLESISAAGPPPVVGVEGAFEEADFSPYVAGADRAATAGVAADFLRDGRIAASSYLGLTGSGPLPRFIGVDDFDHYRANVAALLESEKIASRISAGLADRRADVARDVQATGNATLVRFEVARERHHRGELGIAEYLRELVALRRVAGIGGEPLELVIEKFVAAHDLESSIDFDRVDRERSEVVRRLADTASPEALEGLAAATLAYRAGRLSYGGYYSALRDAIGRDSDLLKRHPEFDRYLRYVALSDGINGSDLIAATRRLSNRLASVTGGARFGELLRRAEDLRLEEKLVGFALTPSEWDDWQALPRRGAAELQSFEAFYREADDRSERMAANLAAAAGRQASLSALVTGGFHTDRLIRALGRRGFSVAVLQPRVTRVEGTGTEYLGLFARDKALLDQLFAGQRLFLARATTNLGFGAVGRETGRAFVAERARRLRTPAPANATFRPGRVQARLLPILAATALFGGLISMYSAQQDRSPRRSAPTPPPSALRNVAADGPATGPAPTSPGALTAIQLQNLRAMKQAIDIVIARTDAKQTITYRQAVQTLLMGAAYSQSGGYLERNGNEVTLYELDTGLFLDAFIDAAVEDRVTNAGKFNDVGTALLGKPVMDSLLPALKDLASQRSRAWAQIDRIASAQKLTPENRAKLVSDQRAAWLNQAATVFNVVPADGRPVVRFDNWLHSNGVAAALGARLKLWQDPEPLIPKRGRPADLTPLVANHAERLGLDREAFLADYDLMPEEFKELAVAGVPAIPARPASRQAPTGPATAQPAPARPATRPVAAPASAPAATPQQGMLQVRQTLAAVVPTTYSAHTYAEQNGVFFYLLLTASHESGAFRWDRQMASQNGRLVPGGPARSYFGIETWSAMDDIPYIASRPNGREWFVASMGETNGTAFWNALTNYAPQIRGAYATIDRRLRDQGLKGKALRRQTSVERTRWLRANIRSFTVDLPGDNQGPIDFDTLLVRTDVAVPFAVAKDRRYRREIVPVQGDLTSDHIRGIYPDYKARWNTPQGDATLQKFLRDGEALRRMPQGPERMPPSAMAMLWAVEAGIRLTAPLAAFLPAIAVRFIVVAVVVPVVEIWAVPLPWFAGWHRNASDAQYRHRVFLQAAILALSIGAAALFGDSGQGALMAFGTGLFAFHSLVNIVEFARAGGDLDVFAAAEAAGARRRVSAALERISPRALPLDLNMRGADIPVAGRRLLALDAVIDRSDLGLEATARELAPALRVILDAEDGAVKKPSELAATGVRLHVLSSGEDPVGASRALSRERRDGRHDLILVEADDERLEFLNATAALPGVTYVNRARLDSEAFEDTTRSLGLSGGNLTIIVGQAAALDEPLVAALRVLAESRGVDGREAPIYLKVGAAAGLAAALLVQIDAVRLTEMLENRLRVLRLVATQA